MLETLDELEWQTVTLDYLNKVSTLVNNADVVIETYGEAFSVLEFLASAGAIDLEPGETPGVHKIRKKTYVQTNKS